MASITLKNVPEDLLDELREDASKERRSLNQQALYLIQVALRLRQAKAQAARQDDAQDPEESSAFKEFLQNGPLGDLELERITGADRDLDL